MHISIYTKTSSRTTDILKSSMVMRKRNTSSDKQFEYLAYNMHRQNIQHQIFNTLHERKAYAPRTYALRIYYISNYKAD